MCFELLVKKYQSRVVSIVHGYVKDWHEAQDVTQEAFIKAHKALPNFRNDSAFYTWIYRIAVNTAKNAIASRARRPSQMGVEPEVAEHGEFGEQLQDVDTPEGQLAQQQMGAQIHRALEALPEDLRTAISLREFDGLNYEDIAEVMQCPVGTVRSRIFRARESIHEALAAMGD